MKILKTILGWVGAVAVLLMLVAAFFPILIPMAVAQGVGTTVFLTSGGGATGAFGRPIPVPAYLLKKNITTQTTTIVKGTPGVLACVVVNKGASSAVVTLYDAPNSANNPFATIDAANPNLFCYGTIFAGGLVVVTSGGNADVTLTYR